MDVAQAQAWVDKTRQEMAAAQHALQDALDKSTKSQVQASVRSLARLYTEGKTMTLMGGSVYCPPDYDEPLDRRVYGDLEQIERFGTWDAERMKILARVILALPDCSFEIGDLTNQVTQEVLLQMKQTC